MSVINFVKNIIVQFYKGLFYWFFWASFVTMRDEMFCSYVLANQPQNQYAATTDSTSGLFSGTAVSKVYDLVGRIQREQRRRAMRACRAFEAYVSHNLAVLRQLMEVAKDLPQRHLVRISLYSG